MKSAHLRAKNTAYPIFLPLGKLRFTNAAICYIIISAEVRKLKVKIVTDEEPARRYCGDTLPRR